MNGGRAIGDGFGVYVHVPFCAHRCGYCDFATWADRGHLVEDYVDACVTDLDRRRAAGLPPASTVFLGGGTPSLLDGRQLARILGAIPRAADAEVTVECNPDTVDPSRLGAYAAAGVNRISLGVQSMRPHVLTVLERTHDPGNVARAVEAARGAGIARINLDLIYGTPGESVDDWASTLDAALDLEPEHVSAYALTAEPATPLGQAVARGAVAAPDDDVQADMYLLAEARLAAAGLGWYEISNWARPGEECRHNLGYWLGADWAAIGCAAHGRRHGRRWWNVRTPERYIERIAAGEDPAQGEEVLGPDAAREEDFGLRLRTRYGVPVHPRASGVVDDLVAAGLAHRFDGHLVLTPSGRLVASDLTARLLLAGAAGA
ncbi:MAG: radical SAM family heme chaperone HemW [Actinomycetes bacterium]